MTGGKRILLVDDDAVLRESLAEQLQLERNFSTVTAASGSEGLDLAKSERFDLILLDVGLPDADGREICRALRAANIHCPIIMLTGADSDTDAVRGLDAGASDYVTKPFKVHVLLARMHAQMRQHEQSDDAAFEIGSFSFRPGHKMLIEGGGRKVRLTDKETAILKYLYRAAGRAVARETLLAEVWGYNAGVTTHTLETHIYRLRQKMEQNPAEARLLVTEGGGYCLVSGESTKKSRNR